MKLWEAVAQYVVHKQSMGMRFHTEQQTLKSFCRHLDGADIAQVDPERVLAFLAGTGPLTRFWQRKHEVLLGFYRFAIARGYVSRLPLPRRVPKPLRRFVPSIFSHDELHRLLNATAWCQGPRTRLEACTCRTLLLLYGAGLRISEALSLTRADVDLQAGLLHVRDSKFYKTRIVPIGSDLNSVLGEYANRRPAGHHAPDAPFFLSRAGQAVTRQVAEGTFRRLRLRADVLRHDGARSIAAAVRSPALGSTRWSNATH